VKQLLYDLVGNPDRYRSRSANQQRRGLSLPLLGGSAGSRLFHREILWDWPRLTSFGFACVGRNSGHAFALLVQDPDSRQIKGTR